jgi:hypothetical protein
MATAKGVEGPFESVGCRFLDGGAEIVSRFYNPKSVTGDASRWASSTSAWAVAKLAATLS